MKYSKLQSHRVSTHCSGAFAHLIYTVSTGWALLPRWARMNQFGGTHTHLWIFLGGRVALPFFGGTSMVLCCLSFGAQFLCFRPLILYVATKRKISAQASCPATTTWLDFCLVVRKTFNIVVLGTHVQVQGSAHWTNLPQTLSPCAFLEHLGKAIFWKMPLKTKFV